MLPSTTRRRCLAALVLAVGALAAPLATTHTGARAAPSTITVVDDHGSRVMLHGIPQRIISLAPNVTEILYTLGAGSRVVGISQDSNYPAAATHKPIVLSYPAGANLEKIVALRPDLLIAAGIDASYLPKLRSLHLPTIILDPGTITGVEHDVALVGTATGASAQAQSVVGRMRARITAVAAHLRGITTQPSVFYEIEFDKGSAYTYGKGTFGDALINLAGGMNVGDTTKGAYPQLSTEQLIAAAPQVIVLGDAAFGVSARSVGQRPGFSAIPAVRSGRVFAMNDDLVSRPGPRIVDGLEQLARLLHPKAFAP